MKKERALPKSKEEQRIEQTKFALEHWDSLPDRLKGRFEGILTAVGDFAEHGKEES